jgi:hypothetical protein
MARDDALDRPAGDDDDDGRCFFFVFLCRFRLGCRIHAGRGSMGEGTRQTVEDDTATGLDVKEQSPVDADHQDVIGRPVGAATTRWEQRLSRDRF